MGDATSRAMAAWDRLTYYGLSDKEVAALAKKSASHLAHIKAEERPASEELAQRLERIADAELAKRIADLVGALSLGIEALCHSQDVPVRDDERELIKAAARDVVALVLAHRPVNCTLPDGIPAALVSLRDDPAGPFVLLLDSHMSALKPELIAHELEDLATRLRSSAEAIKARSEPRPRRAF